jgi:Putative intracellular protease/amidase
MSAASTLPVLLIIASQGYQPMEYSQPKKILQENGFKVVTASNKPGTATTNNGEIKTHVDITTDKVNMQDYQAVFLVGGPGALENLDNEITYKIVQQAKELGKPFGSICISTRILAHAGVINSKNVTGWDGDNELTKILKDAGAIYVKQRCTLDPSENIVTAVDPSCAQEFGKKILEVLKTRLR